MTVLTITEASPAAAIPAACPNRPAGTAPAPRPEAVSRRPAPQSPTVTDLVRLLFEGDDQRRVHGPWRELIADESFRHREGLSPAEHAALSYERLHAVNRRLERAEDLARDPRLLAGLHEWAAIVHGGGGLCTLASIHYNLFLGSLLDHEGGPARDLTEFTTLRRTGTFLCTELAHGNDAPALQTTAEFDRSTGGFVLHTPHAGAQKFMPNTSPTGGPKSAVVAARLLVDGEDQGVFLFLTPLSDAQGILPGIRVRRLPYRSGAPVDHCLTAFDRVPSPQRPPRGGARPPHRRRCVQQQPGQPPQAVPAVHRTGHHGQALHERRRRRRLPRRPGHRRPLRAAPPHQRPPRRRAGAPARPPLPTTAGSCTDWPRPTP